MASNQDEANKLMLDFVKDKFNPEFYGNITLKFQKGFIENIKLEQSITKESLLGVNAKQRRNCRDIN